MLWGRAWATAIREPLRPEGAAGGGGGHGVLSSLWAAMRGREVDWAQRGGRRIKVMVRGEVVAGMRNDAVLDARGESKAVHMYDGCYVGMAP